MAKKVDHRLIPENTIVEVVMRKKMTMAEYESLKTNSKSRSWNIQGYQEGVYSEGFSKKVD